MTKQKKRWRVFVLCAILILLHAQIPQELFAAQTAIGQTEADTRVIPDKYNTGCSGTLTVAPLDTTNGTTVNGVLFIAGAGNTGTRRVMDFCYRNKNISGTVYFENYDFSEFPLWSYNEDKVERQIKLVFNNCKFSSVTVGRTKGNLSFEFNNCTIRQFSGSNTTFNHCQFGNSYSDGLVPFCNVKVNNCFFKDMASVATEAGVHTDGTQLYGIAGTDVQNVTYSNCRFEIPPLKAPGSNAYINACIMFQLEYSSARDVAFNDCIVNGGGFSIYATNKYSDKYTINNVIFDGVRFGCANKYGIFYTKIHNDVTITDVAELDALYVGSVWKESGKTHFSVTNDTNRERTLLIYTDKGQYTYTIPACPKGSEMTESMTYGELPFDMDIAVPADCSYAVCFDSSMSGCGKQIRFVNWSGAQVTLPASVANTLYAGANDILVSGSCGKNVTFTLTKAGVLTLSGTGATYNYHSQKFPDWVAYKDYIKEVYVGEGIETLGSMIFRQCTSIEKVTLPNSLKTLGQYAFGGCVSLDNFTLPENITTLGKNVLSGTPLSEIHYAGDDWSKVTVDTGNENLLERLVVDKDTVKQPGSTGGSSTGSSGNTGSTGGSSTGNGGSTGSAEGNSTGTGGNTSGGNTSSGSSGNTSGETGSTQTEGGQSGNAGSAGNQTEAQTTGRKQSGNNAANSIENESTQSENEQSEDTDSETTKSEGRTDETTGHKSDTDKNSEQDDDEAKKTEAGSGRIEKNNVKNDISKNDEGENSGGIKGSIAIIVILAVVLLVGVLIFIRRKK